VRTRLRFACALALVAALGSACTSQGSPSAAPVMPRFRDVSRGSGLTTVQSVRRVASQCLLAKPRVAREFPRVSVVDDPNYAKEQCQPERMAGGAAAGDFDGDGWPDLYLTRLDGPGVLYRNRHDGTFVDVTRGSGLDRLNEPSNGAAWVDVDRDGRPDLVVTTLAGHRWYLFHNRGGGHFDEQGVARGVSERDSGVHVGFSVNAGDINGDGWPDLVFDERRPSELGSDVATAHTRVFLNRGARDPGVFDDVTARAGVAPAHPAIPYWGFASAIVDLDRDGRPDLVMANDFGGSRVFWGGAGIRMLDGTHAAGIGTDENGMGLTIADYDGDGRLDVFVSSIRDGDPACRNGACGYGTSGNRLYHNDGNRHFTDVTTRARVRDGGWGWGAAFFDPTNSGRLDLVQASGVVFPWEPSTQKFANGPTFLWRNDGRGTFDNIALEAGLTTAGPSKGVVVFDYDRDGRPDLLVVRDGETPVLYRNVTPGSGAWLDVHAVWGRGNADALGAVVTVKDGGRTQVGVIDSTTHFLGQSPSDAHGCPRHRRGAMAGRGPADRLA
jgi:hypothetical protein